MRIWVQYNPRTLKEDGRQKREVMEQRQRSRYGKLEWPLATAPITTEYDLFLRLETLDRLIRIVWI